MVINNDYGVGFEKVFVEFFIVDGGNVINKDNLVCYDFKVVMLDMEVV